MARSERELDGEKGVVSDLHSDPRHVPLLLKAIASVLTGGGRVRILCLGDSLT